MTYIELRPTAATVFIRGTTYKTKRSSLCGKNEKRKTKANVIENIILVLLSYFKPYAIRNGVNSERARGNAE